MAGRKASSQAGRQEGGDTRRETRCVGALCPLFRERMRHTLRQPEEEIDREAAWMDEWMSE